MISFGGFPQSIGAFIDANEVKIKSARRKDAVPYGSPEAKAIIEKVKEAEKRWIKQYGRTAYKE
jgi:hypothetical protein